MNIYMKIDGKFLACRKKLIYVLFCWYVELNVRIVDLDLWCLSRWQSIESVHVLCSCFVYLMCKWWCVTVDKGANPTSGFCEFTRLLLMLWSSWLQLMRTFQKSSEVDPFEDSVPDIFIWLVFLINCNLFFIQMSAWTLNQFSA